MPELPDIAMYLSVLAPRMLETRLEHISVMGPALLRSVDPPVDACEGRRVIGLERLGKRIVLALDHDLFIVIHLMIAGRLRWSEDPGAAGAGGDRRIAQARFDFERGRLTVTEASTHKRATMHILSGRAALREHDPGGVDPLSSDVAAFAAGLRRENRTLKRALTDPRTLSGIGNAYSDEILHRARLSPVTLTSRLDDEEMVQLHGATHVVLAEWTARLIGEFSDRFPGPGDVTAFRPDFAVHGRFGKPCPVCRTAIARIVRGDHETNYCPRCQTKGKLLADRALSRLLGKDWPKTIDDVV